MDQSSGEKLDQVEDQGQGSNDKEIDNSVEKKSSRLSTFIMMWMSIKSEWIGVGVGWIGVGHLPYDLALPLHLRVQLGTRHYAPATLIAPHYFAFLLRNLFGPRYFAFGFLLWNLFWPLVLALRTYAMVFNQQFIFIKLSKSPAKALKMREAGEIWRLYKVLRELVKPHMESL